MERKAPKADGKTKLANGILRKPLTLNNNNLVKNLNEKAEKRRQQKASPTRGVPTALPQGCTPLMYACQQADHRQVTEILRKEPASVHKRDRTLKTALHYCFDNPTAVTADRVLMAAPALLESRDQDGFTPLHLAVIQGNMPLVTFLLANNADVMALDNEKHSVVHWATVCGELEALRAVLSAGADASTADVHGGYPLHYAAQMCGARGGAGAGAGGPRLALDVLGALLRAPAARVDARDGDGRQPLLWAASAGSAPAVLALVKAGAEVEAADKDGLTALHCAASRGHTECIETLLTLCGARTDVIDSNGCTALHYAVTLGHADATALLLQHGADPNRQDRRGRSPAHCGCAKGQLETVKMLGAQNANLWLRNAKGDLPLHEAVASGRRELVKWLLEMRPSQINATNNDGRTLLHIAANTDNTDLCKILLDFGAQVNAVLRTSKNIIMTPLDSALHRGYRSTAKYLQMHGGLPASRLTSRQVVVDQETVPQLPMRHIKTTKINLRDKVAIEKTEIFESSPGNTPRHRRSSKVLSLSESTDYSSDEYELQNKRSREDRRKQKRRLKREQLRRDQSSFSDGYESDRHKRSSRRETKALSDSESSGKVIIKKSKRSKSEPVSKSRSESRHRKKETPKKHKHKKTEERSSESDYDKKYKKRRKKSSPVKSSRSSSSVSEKGKGKDEKKEIQKKDVKSSNLKKDEKSEKQHVEDIEMLQKAAEIAKNIDFIEKEMDPQILEAIIDKQLSESETNTVSVVETTLITEAQVHAESRASLDKDSAENVPTPENVPPAEIVPTAENIPTAEVVAASENIPKAEVVTMSENVPVAEKIPTVEGKPEAENIPTIENIPTAESIPTAEKIDTQEKSEDTSKRKDEEILAADVENLEKLKTETPKENEQSETLKGVIDYGPPRDGITAIIPDSDSLDINTDEGTQEENKISDTGYQNPADKLGSGESIDNENAKNKFVQAIIGILPDDEIKPATSQTEKADSAMGDIVTPEPVQDESSAQALTLINEELSERQETESKSLKSNTSENKTKSFVQQDSEETTAGISEISQKSSSKLDYSGAVREVIESNDLIADGTNEGAKKDKLIKTKLKEKTNQKGIPETKTSQKVQSKKKIQTDLNKSKNTAKDTSSKSKKIYETESYKVLTDTAETEDLNDEQDERNIMKEHVESVMRETGNAEFEDPDRFVKQAGYTRRRISSISDNEMYSIVDSNGTIRRRRLKKKYRDKSRNGSMRSKSQNSERDYESSGMMDSGFEPSPRITHQNRVMSPRLAAYYEDRNASGLYSGKMDSKIPKRKPGDRNAVDMKSVTQIVQTNMRRYFLERKIFQHLMDLKHIQIRAGKANEAVLVKRAIDEYHKSSLAFVGAGRFTSTDYTFKKFEKFLYDSLRKLQRSGVKHLANLPERAFPDFGGKENENMYKMDGLPDNPILCTSKTHRCYHAVHAYTGIPCSAYIPVKLNHHTMPKPAMAGQKKNASFLPQITSKGKPSNSQVTLELCHGNEKQMIALPAEKLDKNKRYYVTFTVKGSNTNSDNENPKNKQPEDPQRNVKSV